MLLLALNAACSACADCTPVTSTRSTEMPWRSSKYTSEVLTSSTSDSPVTAVPPFSSARYSSNWFWSTTANVVVPGATLITIVGRDPSTTPSAAIIDGSTAPGL